MKKIILNTLASTLVFVGGTSAAACWQPPTQPTVIKAPSQQQVIKVTQPKVTKAPSQQPITEVKQPEVKETPATPSQQEVIKETQPPAPKPVLNTVSSEAQQVLAETNVYRTQNGLTPFKTLEALTGTAQDKAEDMATNRYFSHTSPNLGSPFDQMKAAGISYKRAAENIAMGQRSAKEVVDAWMKSPGHRANILNPQLTHMGVGYDAKGHYWVQQFTQ